MPKKESGSAFVGRCPLCKDELVVGWLRDGAPTLDPKGEAKQKIAEKDENDIGKDKQTCTCGNLSALFDTATGRAVFEWLTHEPSVGNVNLH